MSSTLTKWLLFTVKHSGEESYRQQSIIWFLSTASWIQTITNISAEGLYRGSIKTHLISSILHVVSVTLETVAGPRWLRPTQRFRFLGYITTITTLYIKFKGCKCKHTNLNCYSNLQNWLLILICKILEIFSKINPPLAMELQYNVSYSTCDKKTSMCTSIRWVCTGVHWYTTISWLCISWPGQGSGMHPLTLGQCMTQGQLKVKQLKMTSTFIRGVEWASTYQVIGSCWSL